MISVNKHIGQLASLLHSKGVHDVVISPGSRSGPIVHTLAGCGKFNCRSIVDERSAGYFAIGLAQAVNKPVALVCSSGTATLNFAPAVAEAFHLGIPLIVLTADRPGYWIGQGENQTISQGNIYKDFCKKEITLPMGESEKELWHAGRLINETLNEAVTGVPGPVHLNIPLEEPLHDLADEDLPVVKTIDATSAKRTLPGEELEKLMKVFNHTDHIMILAGQQVLQPETENLLAELSGKAGAVVLKEHLSNLTHPQFCTGIDILLTSLLAEKQEEFAPELLITFGGTFVSKPLKQFLRKFKPKEHWHLSLAPQYFDTYQSLTRIIETEALSFFKQLLAKAESKSNEYHSRWKNKETQVTQLRNEFISKAGFCDLSVFQRIQKQVPPDTVVHLGNSSPVRYALICDAAQDVVYMGNRGTSGIDGSLSTAAGFASASEKLNTIILGDLSFFYDSNALWNKYIGTNFRIIVIHNGGGNIFSMIKGPGESPSFREFFFTENKTSAAGIAHTFGLDYLKAVNDQELEAGLQALYSDHRKKAAILEIFTDAELNANQFRELFKWVKNA
jgi:2-succinyl-5-enolpyruvyl-6-hydroxy-3-cyclohexene-1-carboxylate synthase